MKSNLFLPALLLVPMVGAADAAVSETRENAFTIEAVVMVDAAPTATYRSLIRVGSWWDPKHTWSGSAKNLKLDARGGGCFCEKLANGGSVQHARVLFAQPGMLLRLDGALGPLQNMAVTGVLSFALAPDGPGTRVTMTYRVAGALSMDSTKLAPLVDQVMGIQLNRLRDFASGRPVGP